LVAFCQQHGIKFEICGKVIVATQPSELPLLENLFERGTANGLSFRRLTAPQVLELEPHVRCLAGIHVPSTGIVDFVGVSRRLAELIEGDGGELWLGTKALAFRLDGDKPFWKLRKESCRGAGS
jgi:(S)-2-hydroxyglutarate dehydrogenase